MKNDLKNFSYKPTLRPQDADLMSPIDSITSLSDFKWKTFCIHGCPNAVNPYVMHRHTRLKLGMAQLVGYDPHITEIDELIIGQFALGQLIIIDNCQ